jgi:osmotically inducible protein OsmC
MKRTASAVWQGTVQEGRGTLSTQSRVLADTPYSFRSRFADGSETNPEELIGAAHAGCFAMALAGQLGRLGHTAERLTVEATVTLEQLDGKWTISAIHLDLEGAVPAIDAEKFEEVAQDAKANCPVSRVLAAAKITLTAKLAKA